MKNNNNIIDKIMVIREDIVRLKYRIEQIKSKSEKITQMVSLMPHADSIIDKVSDYAILLSELNIMLAKKVRLYVYMYGKVIERAEKILSPFEIDIVKIKIRKNCSNQLVAKMLKTSTSTVFRKYKNAMNIFDSISDTDTDQI